MKRGLRRTLVFLAMVAVGLLLVFLLADPFQQRRPVSLDEQSSADAGRLKLKDAEQRETQMVFGDVTFDVLPEDAASGDKALYRVHILSGRPDETGTFRAEKPVITLLDPTSGEPTGELSADRATFQVGSAVGGTVTIELGRMRVDHSELSGNVRGRFTAADGSIVELACESLVIRGDVVEAPGLVTWSRQGLSVSGYDMQWLGAQGRLVFSEGARLVLPELDGRPGYDLLAPGGLTLDLPPDAPDPRAAAHAELRGRVVGSSTDGRTLEADLLVLDRPAGTVTMSGDAVMQGLGASGERARLTAQQIVLISDADGVLSQAQAEGGVRLTSNADATGASGTSGDAASTWMETEHLSLQGPLATSPDRVTWGHGALSGAGTELSADLEQGRLELRREAELSVEPGADHPLAGLHVVAPGGLSWELPDEPSAAGTGELRGPVHGSLPDGTTFDADRLVFAGAEQGLQLEGHASVRRTTASLSSLLSADHITAVGEGEGRLRLEAEGQVELDSGPPDAPHARLLAQRLRAREGELHCEGPVSWSRAGLAVDGVDLDWNEAEGRIDVGSDAHITLVDAERALDLDVQAEGGLTWVAPPGANDVLAEGRGELRGRVTGHSADGGRMEADRAVFDGPADTLSLLGRASVTAPGGKSGDRARPPLRVASDELLLSSLASAPHLEAAGPVQWESGGLDGAATGLTWDSGTGHLHLQRQVELRLAGAPGEPAAATWTLTAEGALDWQAPADSQAPVGEGRIELSGDVVGRSDRGQAFRTTHLLVEGERHDITLLGPSSFEHGGDSTSVRLVAQQSIALHVSPDGSDDRLVGAGEAHVTLAPAVGPALELFGERLVLDGATRTLTLDGPVSAARGTGDERLDLTATERLLVRVNESNEPVWFEADGDVHLSRGFEARGDTLWWDVPADQAQLQGACRMQLAGAVMSFERAEFAPRARTFKILRATVRVDG